jgi:hypothetical protein
VYDARVIVVSRAAVSFVFGAVLLGFLLLSFCVCVGLLF